MGHTDALLTLVYWSKQNLSDPEYMRVVAEWGSTHLFAFAGLGKISLAQFGEATRTVIICPWQSTLLSLKIWRCQCIDYWNPRFRRSIYHGWMWSHHWNLYFLWINRNSGRSIWKTTFTAKFQDAHVSTLLSEGGQPVTQVLQRRRKFQQTANAWCQIAGRVYQHQLEKSARSNEPALMGTVLDCRTLARLWELYCLRSSSGALNVSRTVMCIRLWRTTKQKQARAASEHYWKIKSGSTQTWSKN